MSRKPKEVYWVKLQRGLLTKFQELSFSEIGLFVVFLLIVAWDPKRKQSVETTTVSNAAIKRWYLHQTSETTIARAKKELVRKGFLSTEIDPEDKRVTITRVIGFLESQKRDNKTNAQVINTEAITKPTTSFEQDSPAKPGRLPHERDYHQGPRIDSEPVQIKDIIQQKIDKANNYKISKET